MAYEPPLQMAKIEKTPTGEFNSLYGCYIILMAVLVFGGIIGWSAWSLFSQDKALGQITQDEKVVPTGPVITDTEKAALDGRLRAFADAAKAGQSAEMSLTIAEINHVVETAPDTGFGSYKEIVRVVRSDPAKNLLIANLAMPVKKLKYWEGKFRYLVGEGDFLIEVHNEGLDAKLVDVRVPGKPVPDGFIGNLPAWPWIAPYRKSEPAASILKGIKKATVTATGLTLSTKP